jgi:hypothetical protein
MLPDTILRIANDKEFQRLLQPELKAIEDGLKYVEDKDCEFDGYECKYRGYLNAQGRRQGVGIVVGCFFKQIGEWHEDELHGICKTEYYDGDIWWGQHKNGIREGFHTSKCSNERVSYYQFKNHYENGYGIKA